MESKNLNHILQHPTDRLDQPSHPIVFSARTSKPFVEMIKAARGRALDENRPSQAAFLQSIADLVDPSTPSEGFARNWPLIIETWRQEHPHLLYVIYPYIPGTNKFADHPVTVFTPTEFFSQGLDWLNRIARGTVSAWGRKPSRIPQ